MSVTSRLRARLSYGVMFYESLASSTALAKRVSPSRGFRRLASSIQKSNINI